MSFFDLDPVASANILENARRHPVNPEEFAPGVLTGSLSAPFTGVAAGINGAAMLAADAATPLLKEYAGKPLDKLFDSGTTTQDWLEKQRKITHDDARALTPDAATSGAVAQALHGMFEIVPQYVAGSVATANPLGGAGVVAAIQGNKSAQLAMDEGVDTMTAVGKGIIEGGVAGVSALIPMHVAPALTASFSTGARLAINAASGAVVQNATGIGSRAAVSSLLDARGYPEMAQQYQAFDKNALIFDTVMGSAFGLLGHGLSVRGAKNGGKAVDPIKPSDVDFALASNNVHHVEVGTAPGVPTDPAARDAHVESINKALADLMAGEPVDVGIKPTLVDFIENPQQTQARMDIGHAIAAHLDLPVIERNLSLNQAVGEINVPSAILGAESSIKIDGTYHPIRWAVVDATNLEATMNKADNQFRDRQRAASQAQISKIANEPDYNLLTNSPMMDFGAPTLTRDGKIVGGNGRFAGVSKAYDQGTHEGYSNPLRKNLSQFGIDPNAAAGMKKPVLVRIIESNVDVKKAALASNEGAGLGMSALEKAKVDSTRLGDISGFKVGENGEILSGPNHSFIRQWAMQMGDTERGTIVDKAGHLSNEGKTRLRNAILHRAFGDSPTLERLVESTDPGARNVATAALRTAPLIADVKSGIEAGSLHPLDISPDIAAAIETLDRIRSEGGSVKNYLDNGEMFGPELSPEARKLLAFLSENIRSAKSLSEAIGRYYDSVKSAGDPNQGSMFGSSAPSKMNLLDVALGDLTPEQHIAKAVNKKDMEQLPAKSRAKLNEMYQGAAEGKQAFDQAGRDIAAEFNGHFMSASLKGSKRAVAKIVSDYKGDASKIKDLLRGTIEIPSLADADAALAMVKENFKILDSGFRNLLDPSAATIDGYRDIKMNVEINGHVAELQINVPEMLAAKDQAHKLYEEMSAINRAVSDRGDAAPTKAEQAKIDDLLAKQTEIYDAAWTEATKAKNSASDTSLPLRMAESESNGRGGSSSQAAQYGTGAPAPNETGMPSTSKNLASFENSIDNSSKDNVAQNQGVGNISTDPYSVETIVSERPDMTIPNEAGGEVLAKDALAQADAEIAMAKRDSQAYDAAVACALRG